MTGAENMTGAEKVLDILRRSQNGWLVLDHQARVLDAGGQLLVRLGLDGLVGQTLDCAPKQLCGALCTLWQHATYQGEGRCLLEEHGVIAQLEHHEHGALLQLSEQSAQREYTTQLLTECLRFETGPVVAYRCLARDPWTILALSPNFEQIGVSREALIGQAFTPYIHAEDNERIAQQLSNAHAARLDNFSLEYRLCLPSGQTRWVQDWNIVTRDADNKPLWIDGYLLDITETVRSRTLSQQALHSAKAGLCLWSRDARSFEWDERCQELFDFEGGRLDGGMQLFERIHPEDRDETRDIWRSLAEVRHHEHTFRVQSPTGWRSIRAWMTASETEQGLPDGVIGMLRDVTEEVERQTHLEHLIAALEQRHQDLQEFTYAVSHDLQEPLRMVSTYVQLLSRRYRRQLDADAERYIGYAVHGAVRMQELIQELLAYARLGQLQASFVRTTLHDLMQAVLSDLQSSLEEHDAQIEIGPLPTLSIDVTLIRRLFVNLIGNALKFRAARRPHIRVQARPVAGGHEIDVIDNGIGFEPEQSERIFSLFKRLHRQDEYPGTGMGLAVCRRIVERHHGTIRATARPGEGATFTIYLPSGIRT